MAITGNDLLKKLRGETDEDEKEDEKDKEKSSSKLTGDDLLKRHKAYQSADTSGVDQKYIDSFIKDSNAFLTTAEKDHGGLGWGTASSAYESRNTTWQDLNARADTIGAWLYKNRDSIDRETYDSLNTSLEDIRRSGSSVMDAFKNAMDYYSQWDTEDAYNAWYAEEQRKEEEKKAVLGASDFEQYSQIGANIENPTYAQANGSDNFLGWKNPFVKGDEIKNIVTFSRDNLDDIEKALAGAGNNADLASVLGDYRYQYMDDEEVSIYNYYLGKGDTKKAAEYLASLDDTLNRRWAGEISDRVSGNAFLEGVFAVSAGLDQFASGVGNLDNLIKGTEADPTTVTQYANATIRENIDGFIGGMAYDLIHTTSHMLPSILVGSMTGGLGGAATLGASAVGNGYAEMRNLGYDEWQSRAYGLLVGASETTLQYALGGIGKLGGKVTGNAIGKLISKFDNAIARTAIKLGGSMASEGLEEALQTVLEPAFKALVTGETFDAPEWEDVWYSALLGALSAGVMEGAPTIAGTAISNHETKQMYGNGSELVTEALDIDPTNEFAQKMQAKVDAGKSLSGSQINRLVESNEQTLKTQDKSKMKSAVEARLTELGETGNLGKIADVIVKAQSGGKLTSAERSVLVNSKYGRRVSTELNPQSIESGEYTSKWAENIGTESINVEAYNRDLYHLAEEQAGVAPVAEEVVAPTKSAPTKEIATESKFEASETGKTTYNGNEVKIQGIASIDNGEVMVQLDNGEVVNARDVEFSTADEALIYEATANMDADTANDFIKGFNDLKNAPMTTPQSAYDYMLGFNEARTYGELGIPYEAMARDGQYANALIGNQAKIAYNRGKINGIYKAKASEASRTSSKANQSKTPRKYEGETHISEIKKSRAYKSLSDTQKAGIEGMTSVYKALGINVYFFESPTDSKGNRTGKNGYFDPSDNSVHIDLYAGLDGRGLILFTGGHELTHYIRANLPAKFKAFADILFEQYEANGTSVASLIAKKRDTLEKKGRITPDMTSEEAYDLAYEEVVADACEAMLGNGEAFAQISEKVKAKDEGLWNTIKKFFTDLVARIKAAYAELSPDSVEGQKVAEMLETATDLQKMWVDMLVEASEASDIVTVDASTESVAPMFSERTWTASEYVINRDAMAKKIAKALGVSTKKAMNYIDDINSIAKMIADDRTRLDYEASSFGSAFVSNVEYGGSFDYTTLCKKRRIYTGTFTEIQKRLHDVALSPDDILKIRNLMIEEGIEATCGLCYVEGSRANMGKFAKEFIRLYKRDNPGAWIPNMADVNTPDGVEQMRINHPEAYDQYVYFWNHYGKLKDSDKALFASQQKPKLYEARKEYKGEILEHFSKDESVEKKNLNGGIRMQSFSDFEIVHLIDTMQVIMDMSTVGLAGQAYTKVPEFAKAFGNTGLKINLSLIAKGVDADGKLIFDDREGMPHETAFDLRNQYSANVGTIIVTFTDEQLLAAMADPRIDFIIPFHRSQWKKGQYGAMGLPKGTKDYTYMQNEKLIKKTYHEYRGRMVLDKASNYMPNEYWDFSKSGKENAEAYLKMCAENNKRPKFYKLLDYDGKGTYSLKADGSTDGYWKLLIDFKMYDNNGVGSPQQAVTPTFNMDEAKTMLDEYKGGHSKYPVASSVVDTFVNEYNKANGTKYSDRASDHSQAALEEFGTTTDYEMAGFVLADGRMLKLSQYGQKGVQHKRIESVYADAKGDTAVNRFIQEGNVRIKATAPGIEIGTENAVSTRQFNAISRFISTSLRSRGRFYLDITDTNGNEVASVEYDDRASASDIVYDIKKYYERGRVPNNDIRYSDRDSSYLDAVNRGDMETAQKMVDEAAKKAGYSVTTYHGTDKDFTVFQTLFRNEFGYHVGTKKAAEDRVQYKLNSKVLKLYTRLGKTIRTTDVFGYFAGMHDYIFFVRGETDKISDPDFIKEMGRKKKLGNKFPENEHLDKLHNAYVEFVKDGYKNSKAREVVELTQHYLKSIGVDSIAYSNGYEGVGSTSYLLMNSNQVKSADPVTYDDDGNVIPLSERFNAENNDIRYSDREIQPITETEIKDLEANFGTTGNFRVAGYLLTDGKLLDFSGKHWGDTTSRSRQVDHRDVQEVIGNRDSMNGTNAMIDMIGSGNIRLMPEDGGINLAVYPNEKQRRVLSAYINYMLATEGQVIIDYDAVGGDTVYSREYGKTATSRQILTDIRNYFNGARQSDLMRFHTMYSDRDYTSYDRTAILKESKVDEYLMDYAAQSSPKYTQAYITYIRPRDFLKLTTVDRIERFHIDEQAGGLDEERLSKSRPGIYLRIDHETREVIGHEGRHRMSAMANAGIYHAPVLLIDTSNKMTKTDLEQLILHGQFDKTEMGIVEDVIPLNYENRDRVIKKFATQSTSQRIGEKYGFNKTLRFSDRNPDSVSNRSLLANALESVAQNDIERNKLKEYKGKIALIESEQAKLADTKAKIKELSFAKGRRDTEAIKKLQFEANQTANRINTYDRQLLNLEATAALKGVLQREKQLAYKKAEKEGKEALAKYREKAAKTQRELLTRYQESRKKGVEGRKKTEMRHKIKNVVNELNQYLLKGTKEKHVPIELQKAVAEALDAVNMDTVNAEERIAKKRDEMLKAKTPEAIEKLAKEIANIREMGGNMANKLSVLKTAYDSIINSDDPLIANSHDDVISNSIDKVVEVIGETPLRDMSLYQLEAVYDLYKMVLKTIQNTNKAFKAEKGESISIIANGVIAELVEGKQKSPYSTKASQAVSEYVWNNLKPVYAFERIGSKNFTKVFNAVRAGEDVWAKDMNEAQAFREAQFKKFKYDSWDFKKRFRFTSTSGKSFELSLDQILSLYAFSKREQAGDHLKYGGFVFDGLTEVKQKNKVGMTVTYQLKDATAYNLSEETLAEIIGKLTPEQKEFADTMQDYLSTVMGEKGNEVSLELYDVKLFKEKNYFPLKSAPQYLAKAKEQAQGEVKIKNSGFTKETTPNAKNPIVLSSFMDVWAGHVNEMSLYHAFTLPLEDFYRVYNYHTPADEKMSEMSVGSSLENAHGQAAVKYIDQLLKDLNGGARSDPRETLGKAMMSNFKKASVMASLSVVVQQPTAIVRATAVVNSKYFFGKPLMRKHKDAWAEVKKYAPVAVIKEMGYFDTGMGKGSVEWLKGDKNFMDKVDDAASKLPALADEITWVAIWNAVKRETVHTHKHLAPNSDAFLKAVGERFTEVITKTQVYDSTLSRSANMRSKGVFMQMLTSFMAEPTTSINMLLDAFHKGNKKYIARTMAAVYGSVILNSALVSIVYAMRDDDEDETFIEKYLSRLTTEAIDNANPLTYLPIVKDIWSAAQGFDIERADMSLITDLIGSFQQLTKVINTDTSDMEEDELAKHKKEVTEAILSITDGFGSLAGIPVKNIRRDINGAINFFRTVGSGQKTTAGSLGDNVIEDLKDSIPVWGWLPDKSKGEKLYDAIIKGDTVYIDRLKSGYKSEDSYYSAVGRIVREHLEDGDLTATEAERLLVNYGGKDEEEAFSRVQYWEFKMDYPDYDLSEEAVAKYYTDVEPWGIDMDVYYDYYQQKAECKGIDEDGDGRADSGTKKAEVMELIDSLPISNEQKDALYYLNGWSESTIGQAPWH